MSNSSAVCFFKYFPREALSRSEKFFKFKLHSSRLYRLRKYSLSVIHMVYNTSEWNKCSLGGNSKVKTFLKNYVRNIQERKYFVDC